MIDNGFVYAVNISTEKIRKKELTRNKKVNKLYEILKNKNVTLNEATTKDFNKTQTKLIRELGFYHYLEMNEKYN